MGTAVHRLSVAGHGQIELTVAEYGTGRRFLFLHGGTGPGGPGEFAKLFTDNHAAHVVIPTHPGFSGTARPDWLDNFSLLAQVYSKLLDELNLQQVTVVGNSLGGWIAAELTLCRPEMIGALVILDAIGIEVPGHPVANVHSLTADELNRKIYHDPSKFENRHVTTDRAASAYLRPTLAPATAQVSPSVPPLLDRLHQIGTPTLVLWGESDGIVDTTYGRAYATAIPGALFQILPDTGHDVYAESPKKLLQLLWEFPHPQNAPPSA